MSGKKKAKSSIRLSQQGILLVSIPLLCQIIFIVVLSGLLAQVEQEAYRAEHTRNILAETDRIVALFYEAATALATYDMTKNPLLKMAYENSSDKVVSHLLVLRRLTANDPAATESADIVDSSAGAMIATMASMEDAIDRGRNPLSANQDAMQTLQGVGDKFTAELSKLTFAQRQIESTQPEHDARLRSQVETCLLAGVLLNIVLAFALARGFYRVTASRLSVLMQNTQRLVKHLPLHPPIEGNDEIAELDQFFRVMASALDAAAKHKQELLRMVSHDLRSPLTASQLSLSLMSAGVKGEVAPEAREELERVQNSLGRLVHLINDLLDIEKMESGHMSLRKRQVNLQVIVENSLDAVSALAVAKHVDLVEDDTDLDIFADGERLAQVIINLVSNAIKVSPENTKITVSASVESDWVQVSIKDEGPGIDKEHQQMIFDRFQQLPNSTSGTGLGLAICKAIVEQHGGIIGVDSTLGQGSVFWFKIPMQSVPEETNVILPVEA